MAHERNDDTPQPRRVHLDDSTIDSPHGPEQSGVCGSEQPQSGVHGPFDLRDIVAIATIANAKACTRCGQEKPLSEFHKRRHYVRAGVRSACKACTSAGPSSSASARQAPRREQLATKSAPPSSRAERAHDPDFRQKNRVRMRTRRAIAAGLLVPGPCAECGDVDVQAHHESYDGPRAHLQVAWLCREHHSRAHGRRNWTRQLTLLL